MFAATWLMALVALIRTQASNDADGHVCKYSYENVSSAFPDPVAPEKYTVQFKTNLKIDANGNPAEPIVLEVTRSWAPIGADHFYSVVSDGFYNCAAFFRVVPDFVVQWGIAASPIETAKWNASIPDDPVLKSNVKWTVSYATAGPNTRTTQLFINTIDNSRLDEMGFAPFAVVTRGFATVLAIHNPTPDDSNGVDQDNYTQYGNDWIVPHYPNITLITSTELS